MSLTSSSSNNSLNNLTQNSLHSNHINNLPHDVVVWNLNSFKDKLYELKILVKKYEPKVICLQETRLLSNNDLKFRGYQSVVNSRTTGALNASGGVAILVKNGYDYERIDLPNDIESIALKIYLEQIINICCIYIPPNHQTTVNQLLSIKNKIRNPCILTGDFNAHNFLWGSDHVCPRGQMVEDFVNLTNLIINNTGKMTRTPMNLLHRQSAIDICLSDINTSRIIEWDVDDDSYRSDHHPIILNFIKSRNSYFKRKIYKLDKADWKNYTVSCDIPTIDPTLNNPNINEIYSEIVKTITIAADKNIPVSKEKPIKPIVPWWHDDVKIVVKNRKKALDKYKISPTRDNLILYLKARSASRRLINERKTETWERYVSTINPETSSKEVWGKIRKIEGRTPKSSFFGLRTDLGTVTDPLIVANILGEAFAKVSCTADYNPNFINIKEDAELNDVFPPDPGPLNLDSDFTMLELDLAFSKAKGKSPGPNNLPYQVFIKLNMSSKRNLLHFYNRIWQYGIIPDAWRSSLVIPLIKNPKKASTPDNSRPIALENCESKLMEKMVNNRLIWYIEDRKFLSENQMGFRKCKNTMHNLTILENDIHEAFALNRHIDAVCFDIKKAYDKIWRHGILRQLVKWKICGKIFSFIKDFLTNRNFKVLVGNVRSNEFPLENGVPQGSVLSVTLFLIGINGLAETIAAHKNIKFLLYADDLIIYRSGTKSTGNETALQSCIDSIENYSLLNGFQFSLEKTSTIHFCKKRNCYFPKLYFENLVVKDVRQIKFLGMIFDSRLSWRNHVNEVKAKCNIRMNVIKVLSNIKWGSNRDQLLKMVQCLILSVVEYGCHLYDSASTNVLKVLDPLLNTGIRLATGAFRTSPISSLLCEAGFMNLSTIRKFRTILFYLKIHEFPDSFLYKSLILNHRKKNFPTDFLTRAKNIIDDIECEPSIICKRFPCLNPLDLNKISIDLSMYLFTRKDRANHVIRMKFKEVESSYLNCLFIYTDGSKSSDGSGYAVVLPNKNIIVMTNTLESIYSIESKAILKACKLANEMGLDCDVVIASDSLSAINAIFSPANNDSLILAIKSEVLKYNKKMTFLWVPAHTGIHGNEIADENAALAAVLRSYTDDNVTYKDAKSIIESLFMSFQNKLWMPNTSHLRAVKHNMHKSIYAAGLTRHEAVAITRLRIGHTNVTHQHYMSKDPRPICPFCDENLTVPHLLMDCTNLKDRRLKFDLPKDLSDLLNNTDSTVKMKNLISYLTDINLLHLL